MHHNAYRQCIAVDHVGHRFGPYRMCHTSQTVTASSAKVVIMHINRHLLIMRTTIIASTVVWGTAACDSTAAASSPVLICCVFAGLAFWLCLSRQWRWAYRPRMSQLTWRLSVGEKSPRDRRVPVLPWTARLCGGVQSAASRPSPRPHTPSCRHTWNTLVAGHMSKTHNTYIITKYFNGFYRAMHFSAKRGIAIACRLSVCLSVCL